MKVTEFFSRLDKIGHELELNGTNFMLLFNVQISIKFSDSLDLNEMLPSSLDSFFTYQGSLTTPPLSEVLTMTINYNVIFYSVFRILVT